MWWPLPILARLIGPETQGSPERHEVAVEVLHVVLDRPPDQRRARDLPALGPVVAVVLEVDAQPGPVVLEHGPHGERVVQGGADVVEVLLAHGLPLGVVEPVPGVGVGRDDPLGVGRPGEEEPVPPLGREPRVDALGLLDVGEAVEHGESRHPLGVVERGAVGHALAAVVARHREALAPQVRHQGHDVLRHGSVAVVLVPLVGPGVDERP